MVQSTIRADAFESLDSESAWAFGVLWADGAVFQHNRGYYISLQVKDDELVEKVASILEAEDYLYDSSEYLEMRFSRKQMFNDLNDRGMVENKTENGGFPIVDTNTSDFARGLFDGDGWFTVDKNNYGKFGIVGHEDTVSWWGQNTPVEGNVYERGHTDTVLDWQLWGRDDMQNLYNWLYDDNSTCLERKRKYFKGWLLTG